ncbi:hypothetical protein CVS40_11908 [Lucilia cuprina]|nr:hypothetical protein CVS40_11908 [Lucilia cuprina]
MYRHLVIAPGAVVVVLTPALPLATREANAAAAAAEVPDVVAVAVMETFVAVVLLPAAISKRGAGDSEVVEEEGEEQSLCRLRAEVEAPEGEARQVGVVDVVVMVEGDEPPLVVADIVVDVEWLIFEEFAEACEDVEGCDEALDEPDEEAAAAACLSRSRSRSLCGRNASRKASTRFSLGPQQSLYYRILFKHLLCYNMLITMTIFMGHTQNDHGTTFTSNLTSKGSHRSESNLINMQKCSIRLMSGHMRRINLK